MQRDQHGRRLGGRDHDDMGDGPGFRKVRQALGVTAFGVNAIVIPPGYASGRHLHERQEEPTSCTAAPSSSARRGHARRSPGRLPAG